MTVAFQKLDISAHTHAHVQFVSISRLLTLFGDLISLGFFFLSYCDPVEAAASLGINGTGVVTPTDCPQGHYCPLSTPSSTSYPCPIGTFNNDTKLQASTSCLPCTAGFYCEAPGKI